MTSNESTYDVQQDKRDTNQRQTKKSRSRRGNRGRAPISSGSALGAPNTNILGQNTNLLQEQNKQQPTCSSSTVGVNIARGTKVQ